MIEFRQIRYATVVAKHRSFTVAAKQLNISQSAVSEQVKLLEDRLGLRLLDRTGRGVKVTDQGQVFLSEADRVVTDMMYLIDLAHQLSETSADKLNVGLVSGIAPMLIPRLFPKGAVPEDLRLDIRTAPTRTIFDDLYKERLDIGFAMEVDPDLVPSGLTVRRLFDTEIALITPKGHPLGAGSGPVSLERIANEPIIMSELSVGYGLTVMNMFSNLGVRPVIRAVVDNIETLKVMVVSGIGNALVPVDAASNEVSLGLLDVVPIKPSCRITFECYRPRATMAREKEVLYEKFVSSQLDPPVAEIEVEAGDVA